MVNSDSRGIDKFNIDIVLLSKECFFFNSVVFTMSSLFDYDEVYSIYLLYAITFDGYL